MFKHLPDAYEEKYVAYLDILGFSEKIDEMENDNQNGIDIFRIIKNAFDQIEVELRTTNHFVSKDSDNAQFAAFSDSMALSTAPTDWGLMSMITRISGFCMNFMKAGIFIRGAISKGHVYHKENQLFGSGLVHAVKLEKKLARYPRVVLSEQVVQDMSAIANPLLHGWRNEISLLDRDGVTFLSPFYPQYASEGEGSGYVFAENQLKAVVSHIKKQLSRFGVDDERHAKIYWLKEQINDAIDYWQARGQLGSMQKI